MTVEVAVDGGAWQRALFASGSGRYEFAWNTASHTNGYHSLVARATDSSGQSAESDPVRVAVNNITGTPPGAVQLPSRIEAEDFRQGGAGIGYFDTTVGNSGNRYRATEDVDIQPCSDVASGPACLNIGWVRVGEWLAYDVIVPSDGLYVFTFRVASASAGRSVMMGVDGQNVSGTIAVPNTGGSSTWGDVGIAPIQLSSGVHTIRFVSNSSSFNLNYIEVTRK